jgi:hypothetical protein
VPLTVCAFLAFRGASSSTPHVYPVIFFLSFVFSLNLMLLLHINDNFLLGGIGTPCAFPESCVAASEHSVFDLSQFVFALERV